jgi:hypothetical protein
MSDLTLEIITAFMTGFAASYLLWYYLNKIKVPVIEFKPSIFKSPTAENLCGWKYRAKFRNEGGRAALDLEIVAKLRIRGLYPSRPERWHAIYVPIEDPRIPKVDSNRKTRKVLSVLLLPNDISESARSILPENLQEKCNLGTLCLEDLLSSGSESKLQIFAFGYDEFSGARKLFESPEYFIDQIQNE